VEPGVPISGIEVEGPVKRGHVLLLLDLVDSVLSFADHTVPVYSKPFLDIKACFLDEQIVVGFLSIKHLLYQRKLSFTLLFTHYNACYLLLLFYSVLTQKLFNLS